MTAPSTPARNWARIATTAPAAVLLALPAVLGGGSPASATVPPGTLAYVAGTGTTGTPAPGPALNSGLDTPYGTTFDSAGNLYIADYGNNVIEKVTPAGQLSIVAGTGTYGAPTAGSATSSDLANPYGVAVDGAGDLLIADYGNHVIEKVTPAGQLSVVVGNGTTGAPVAGPATSSPLGGPASLVVVGGTMFIADYDGAVVEKVTAAGQLSVIAGTGTNGTVTPGAATSSDLSGPDGIDVDSAGNVYIGDYGDSVVVKVTPAGQLSIFAGTGTSGPATAGPATASELGGPGGVVFDAAGNLYIADYSTNQVEKVTPAGALSIVAGTGTTGDATEGPALASDLNGPEDVAINPAGNLYIADSGNERVESVSLATVPTGPIATKYAALGGPASLLGAAVGSEFAIAGGRAQRYLNGAIYWSAATGAHEIHGAIREHWLALGGAAGPLGFPGTDELGGAGAGRLNRFTGGVMFWSPTTGAHAVHGSILVSFAALGPDHGPLGYPTTDELTAPDGVGRYNHFTGGSIYWSPTWGAQQVHGAIGQHWADLGWETGLLSYPATNELTAPDGAGRYNHFAGGSIYWTPAVGAHEVHGSIRATWAGLGWERSALGYPVSDEYGVPAGRQSDFQHGTMTYIAATGSVTVTHL